MLAGARSQYLLDFGSAHDYGQALWRPRSADFLQPGQVDLKDLFVEKNQGRERLLVSRDGRPVLVGKPG